MPSSPLGEYTDPVRYLSPLPFLIPLLTSCTGSAPVVLQGYLFDTPFPTPDSVPVAGILVDAFLDEEPEDTSGGGEQGVIGSGSYLVGPFEERAAVHIHFHPPEGDTPYIGTLIPATLPDTSLDVDDGVFHIWTEEGADKALPGSTPSAADETGALVGTLSRSAARVGSAVSLETADGSDWVPVYLDEDGEADLSLAGTSVAGGYAFSGLPSGPAILHTGEIDLAVWVLAGSITSLRGDTGE